MAAATLYGSACVPVPAGSTSGLEGSSGVTSGISYGAGTSSQLVSDANENVRAAIAITEYNIFFIVFLFYSFVTFY